jgi:hypothetical protein
VLRLVPLLALVLVLSACGGSKSGGSTLSKKDYKAKLAAIARQANAAQGSVSRGLSVSTVPALKATLQKFSNDSRHIGDEVAALKPPNNAAAANAQLAKGEHDTAAAIDAALPKLGKFKNVHDALLFLQKQTRGNSAGRELDGALTKLRGLGYISSTSQ